METVKFCPICGSNKASLALHAEDYTVSHERYSIRQCEECGFLFTSPRPTPERLGEYYLSEDYISHAEKATSLKDHIYHRVRRRAIRSKHRLIAKYHESGRALDMGCGTGDFLAFLNSRGYAAQGIEVSPKARKAAVDKGVRVSPTLADLPANAEFNVITMWHALEHMPDPRNTLTQLFKRCSKGGLLVIAVPDNESWDCSHYGSHWAAWDVPRHLSHFRRKDIHRLLTEVGFIPSEPKNMWFDAPYVSMLSEQYRGRRSKGALWIGVLFGMWSNLVAIATNRPTSSTLYLAQKP